MSCSRVFKGHIDRFRGVTVNSLDETCDDSTFSEILKASIERWRNLRIKGVWFKVALEHASWVPVLAQSGFKYHHAHPAYVTMVLWLPDNEVCNIPSYAHTMVGVGAIVINEKRQILVVREKYHNVPHWKLPGGYVEPGEDISSAAEREVMEETNVRAQFKLLVCFKHTHATMFGCSDLYYIVALTPEPGQETLKKCDLEIEAVKWMDVGDYLKHSHLHSTKRFFVQKYLEYEANDIALSYHSNGHALPKKTYKIYSLKGRVDDGPLAHCVMPAQDGIYNELEAEAAAAFSDNPLPLEISGSAVEAEGLLEGVFSPTAEQIWPRAEVVPEAQGFRVLYTNIDDIRAPGRFGELSEAVKHLDPDVIVLTETMIFFETYDFCDELDEIRLKSEPHCRLHPDRFSLDGYHGFHNFAYSTHTKPFSDQETGCNDDLTAGGNRGVAIYLKADKFVAKERAQTSSEGIASMKMKITDRAEDKLNITLSAVYRSHGHETDWRRVIDTSPSDGSPHIVLGDVNLDLRPADPELRLQTDYQCHVKNYLDFIHKEMGFKLCNRYWTNHSINKLTGERQNPTLIDHFWVKNITPLTVYHVLKLDDDRLGDHCFLVADFVMEDLGVK